MIYFIIAFMMFALCFVLHLLKDKEYNVDILDKQLYIVFSVILFFLAAFRDGIGLDYRAYESIFYRVKSNGIFPLVSVFEPFFLIINSIVPNFRMLLIVCCFLGVVSKEVYYYKYTSNKLISLALYFCSVFLYYDIGILREGIAISMSLFSLKYIYTKDFKRFLLAILLASSFHASSLIMMFLYFFPRNKLKRYIYYTVPAICYFLSGFGSFLISRFSFGFIGEKIQRYISVDSTLDITVFVKRFFLLFVFVEVCVYFEGKEKIDSKIWLLLNGFFMGVCCMLLFPNLSDIIGRVSAYFYFLQIPIVSEIVSVKKETIATNLILLLMFAFSVYSCYNIIFNSAGDLYYPYKSVIF